MNRQIVLSLSSFIIILQVIYLTFALQCFECEEVRHIDGELVSGNCSMNGGARIMTHCLGRCGRYVWFNRKFKIICSIKLVQTFSNIYVHPVVYYVLNEKKWIV